MIEFNIEDIEISEESAVAIGDVVGSLAGLIAAGTPIAPLAPFIGLAVAQGLKLTNAGYKVQGLSALQKKAKAIEGLPDLTAP
ncbi:hypothetical protein [Desulfovibrio gilichinskyi]|uniref:Uncharacterized protein n=1 Tax=Desulfovibrio gilichinskyi TaxID=1519643 RepID=A0A1X7C3H6_9BACT|nr:hypothetical protein [Desulfovibrio gilichinskyi]SME89357.1 hypothetical protein SAMN06295933_0282 [Desulfovibrio gilichinskyi]